MCEQNDLVDRIDKCEKVLKLILTLIPYHKSVIYVAKPNGWLNGMDNGWMNGSLTSHVQIYI